ncbi:MAG: hypothetical protein ACTHMS_12985 [Jatrophihabitans sp.]|uniref:hypothetical protein n=1 Tax=Jatrophihabitans sp. TaxID=1932789 RepID=UPI003F7DE52F
MRRLFWLSLGATLGVLIMRRVERLIASLTPRSLAVRATSRVREIADELAAFAADVREAASEREAELRRSTLHSITGGSIPGDAA